MTELNYFHVRLQAVVGPKRKLVAKCCNSLESVCVNKPISSAIFAKVDSTQLVGFPHFVILQLNRCFAEIVSNP